MTVDFFAAIEIRPIKAVDPPARVTDALNLQISIGFAGHDQSNEFRSPAGIKRPLVPDAERNITRIDALPADDDAIILGQQGQDLHPATSRRRQRNSFWDLGTALCMI